MSLWLRLTNVFRGDGLNRDIDEEVQSHIVEAVEHGRDPAEVRRSFGLRPPLQRREPRRTALGRLLTENDDLTPGAHPYAVLSQDYWTHRFAQDPKAVGRTLRMDDEIYEIVGVAQAPFTGIETGTVTDIFVPMAMRNPRTLASANKFWLRTLVQLKPGAAAEPVRERLRATFRAIQEERAKGSSTCRNSARICSSKRGCCWSPRPPAARTCRESTAGRWRRFVF